MKKAALLVCLTLFACTTGCTAPREDVNRILADQGYTEISVGGASIFACSKGDTTSNTFTAKGRPGVPSRAWSVDRAAGSRATR